jgi:hypothetical protein
MFAMHHCDLRIRFFRPASPPSSERTYRPRSGNGCAPVPKPLRNEILFAGLHWSASTIDNKRVTALHDHHVLVELVRMWLRNRSLAASPERHLTPVCPVKHVTFHSRRCLAARRDPVHRPLHEFRKVVHACHLRVSACLILPPAYLLRTIPSVSPFIFLRF